MSSVELEFVSAHSDLIDAIKEEIKVKEAHLYDLQIELQKAEAEISNLAKLDTIQPVRTKFKWFFNQYNYRVAVVTNEGVLQVKSVVGNIPEYSDIFRDYRGENAKARYFLKKTLFKDEASWRASLPEGGSVKITSPPIPAAVLREMCNTPLTETADPLKLKELEERFNGGIFVLTTPTNQMDIEYCYENISEIYPLLNHRIMNSNTKNTYSTFHQMGTDVRPRLMVIYKSLYVDLSHLF